MKCRALVYDEPGLLQLPKKKEHGIMAVSYTHLDVYKRQYVLYAVLNSER